MNLNVLAGKYEMPNVLAGKYKMPSFQLRTQDPLDEIDTVTDCHSVLVRAM
jgi:hypothetical protein